MAWLDDTSSLRFMSLLLHLHLFITTTLPFSLSCIRFLKDRISFYCHLVAWGFGVQRTSLGGHILV